MRDQVYFIGDTDSRHIGLMNGTTIYRYLSVFHDIMGIVERMSQNNTLRGSHI